MLKISATAVCNRCKVNRPISVVFIMVSWESRQNAPTIFICKSQSRRTQCRKVWLWHMKRSGELWVSKSAVGLGPTPVSFLAVVKGDRLRICWRLLYRQKISLSGLPSVELLKIVHYNWLHQSQKREKTLIIHLFGVQGRSRSPISVPIESS